MSWAIAEFWVGPAASEWDASSFRKGTTMLLGLLKLQASGEANAPVEQACMVGQSSVQ